MSVLGYFDLAFTALAAGAACFAVALLMLGSVMTWASSIGARTEALFARGVWMSAAVGGVLIATAIALVLFSPAIIGTGR